MLELCLFCTILNQSNLSTIKTLTTMSKRTKGYFIEEDDNNDGDFNPNDAWNLEEGESYEDYEDRIEDWDSILEH